MSAKMVTVKRVKLKREVGYINHMSHLTGSCHRSARWENTNRAPDRSMAYYHQIGVSHRGASQDASQEYQLIARPRITI